jgi:hypothetical protein
LDFVLFVMKLFVAFTGSGAADHAAAFKFSRAMVRRGANEQIDRDECRCIGPDLDHFHSAPAGIATDRNQPQPIPTNIRAASKAVRMSSIASGEQGVITGNALHHVSR